MTDICLDVEVRENTGTGPARASRNDGFVPGVLYGGKKGAVAIALRQNEVLKALNSGSFLANMIEISHKGEKQKVITKDVQFHPVSDMPLHVDFYRVDEDSIIDVEVSVHFIGEDNSPGIRHGGVLNVVRHAIEVSCPAGQIPESIEVDISKLEIGDSLHISQVSLPDNVSPSITDRDFTIATMMASRSGSTGNDAGEAGEGVENEDT